MALQAPRRRASLGSSPLEAGWLWLRLQQALQLRRSQCANLDTPTSTRQRDRRDFPLVPSICAYECATKLAFPCLIATLARRWPSS